jgi:opine dehydrogenase
MSIKKIAILGAGNGGITAAADLTLKGFEVRLFELPRFFDRLATIRKKGGITLKRKNHKEFCSPAVITDNIALAIKSMDVVMLTVPSFAIEEFATLSAPFLEKGQVVLINGATALSSLRFVNAVEKVRRGASFKIGETASLTYASRVTEDGEVELGLEVKSMLFAAYPNRNTSELIEKFRELYPILEPAKNIWETCLNNGNPESHPGPSLLNAGRIEFSGGDFYLYKEGITPHVSNIVKAISHERQLLCNALEVNYISTSKRLIALGYAQPAENLHELYNQSEVFAPIKGPLSLTSRYFIEDISNGLVLWSSLGKTLQISTPNIDAIITLSGSLINKDYWSEGLTLDKLGLFGLNADELTECV